MRRRAPAAPRRRAEPAAHPRRRRRRIHRARARRHPGRGRPAAGVGVGTVYRRFPDKEALVDELFKERIDALVTVAEEACTAPDPWQALVSYLEYAAAAMAGELGLRQLMMFATYDRDQVCYARDRMRPVITRLVERAQASGDLRPDFGATDVKIIAFMLASSPSTPPPSRLTCGDATWRILIDGLRPARAGSPSSRFPPPPRRTSRTLMSAHGQRLAHGAAPLTALLFTPATAAHPRSHARASARAFLRAFSNALLACTIYGHHRQLAAVAGSAMHVQTHKVPARASANVHLH